MRFLIARKVSNKFQISKPPLIYQYGIYRLTTSKDQISTTNRR